jgi:chain length determinant protein tyrosine kinase EpsG
VAQTSVISASIGTNVSTRGDRSIGAILIDIGRLKAEDAERIMRVQREQGLLFGDAAIRLGLLTQADIDMALLSQFNYPCLVRGQSPVSENLVAAYTSSGPQLEALRALRSQLMLRWFDNDPSRKALAIISGERREGRSYIVANLAVVFSQLGERTLLIDADLRHPCQHVLFGLNNRAGLSAVLSGRGGPELIQRVPGLADLSVLTAGALPPNPLELLAQPLFPQLLRELREKFDIILFDSPAAANYADAQTLAVRAGAALIIARKNVARMWRVRGVSDSVVHASATIVGTVLNDF